MAMDLVKLRGLYMPRLSWKYEKCAKADLWFLMAQAFQECSYHLLEEMIEGRMGSSFFHAKAVVSLFERSVEHFLKGGMAQAGKEVPTHHFLDELYKQFKNLYPGKKFEFTGSITEMVQRSNQTPFNEFANYPTDQSGNPWEGSCFIDIVTWFEQASKFVEDFKRLKPLMKERYSGIESAGGK